MRGDPTPASPRPELAPDPTSCADTRQPAKAGRHTAGAGMPDCGRRAQHADVEIRKSRSEPERDFPAWGAGVRGPAATRRNGQPAKAGLHVQLKGRRRVQRAATGLGAVVSGISVTTVVMEELEKLRRDGPTDAEVQIVKETEKRELETSLKQNGYWLNSLQAVHLLGRDPLRILQRTERAESLSKDNIHAAFRKYFPQDRHTVVTLMPETTAPKPVAAR